MGKYLLLLLILLLATSVAAITMRVGDSYYINGKNVTLISIDGAEKNAVFCVNGIKSTVIFTKKEVVNLNGARLEVFDNTLRSLKVRINADPCLDCFCDKYCSNAACYNNPLPDCNEDIECNDNNNLTEDRCLRQKCYNIAEEPMEKEEIEKREEVISSFKGVEESSKKFNPLKIITPIILLLLILIIVLRFIFRK